MGRFLKRLAPLGGLVFIGLIVVAFVVGGNTPGSSKSGADVISYYEAHRTAQLTTAILLGYAMLFGLIFAASVRGYVRARSGSDSVIAFGFAGYVLFAVGIGTFGAMTIALADAPGKLDPSAAQALNVVSNDTFFVFLVGMGTFMLGNGLAIALSGALPRWIGWVGFAIGIAAVTPVGWLAMFGVLGWSLVVSILIFIRDGKRAADQVPSQASPAPAPAA
jgi:hypothetical protein